MPHTITQTLSQLTIQDMIHARIVSLFLLLSATAEVKAFILRAHQKARFEQINTSPDFLKKQLLDTLHKYEELIGESHPLAYSTIWEEDDEGLADECSQGRTADHQPVAEVCPI